MAFLNETFSVDSLPQSSNSFEVLPEGWYSATIAQAELKTTSSGTGQYIKVRYDITGPTHQGRVVFGNLNIRNANPKAEEIGRQQLGELMRAIGLASVQDTDQLIGGKLNIKLAIRRQEGYEPSNEVKGFKALTGAAPAIGGAPFQQPAQQQYAQPAAAQAAPAAASVPPWAAQR